MGYSCGVRASLVLEAIKILAEFNTECDDYRYHIEVGRENKDGSITGRVYEVHGSYRVENNLRFREAGLRGTFKIAADGEILRFAGLACNMWGVVQIAAIEAYDKMYCKIG